VWTFLFFTSEATRLARMSDELKKQGDKAYKEGNYTDAENYYSQA
jgi:hypothetical protein